MKSMLFGATLVMAVAALAVPAEAKIGEVRFAVADNIQDAHGDIVDGKEGTNVELEIVSPSNCSGRATSFAAASRSNGSSARGSPPSSTGSI